MRLRFLQIVIFQSVAPVSLLILSIIISRLFGPADQGAFAAAKSWFDVLVAVGCFGLPQSCIFAINRDGGSRQWLYKMAFFYSLTLIPLFALVSWQFHEQLTSNILLSIGISFGAGCVVLINIWRGILLTLENETRFHLITILPIVALVIVIFVGLLNGRNLTHDMPFFYAVSGVIILPIGFLIFPLSKVQILDGVKPNLMRLFTNGAELFIQALSITLQTFICLNWLKKNAGLEEAGYFSISLIIINSFVFPLQAIAPMILNRWSQHKDSRALNAGKKQINIALIVLTFIAIFLILLIFYFVPLILGEKFVRAIPAMQISALVIIPTFLLRIDSLRLSAVGQFRINSAVAVMRCSLLVVLLVLLTYFPDIQAGALVVSYCWLMSEICAALFTRYQIRRLLLMKKSELI